MKKRLLALCLAAALLVSLAPALRLSAGVSAAKADVVVQDKLINESNGVIINSTTYNTSDTTHAPNGSGTGLSISTSNSTAGWAKYLEIDHTKTVEWQSMLQFNVFHDKGDATPCVVTESGAIARYSCMSLILNDSDAENGGFVLPFLYSSNQKLYIQFLMPGSTYGNDIYSEAIDLGATYADTYGGRFTNRYELKLVWLPNGSVEVWFNTSVLSGTFIWSGWQLKATVQNATWEHGTDSEPVIYGQDDKSADAYDFILYGLHNEDNGQSVYVWDASVTSYTTFAEALLTGETINSDNKLDEVSWRYASWEKITGDVAGEAAVLMKNGEAYVAIKAPGATSATVTLGNNTKTVDVVGGVAEIKIEDASIDSVKETLAYSVTVTDGTKTGTVDATMVTLNSHKVNDGRTGEGTVLNNDQFIGGNGVYYTQKNATINSGNNCILDGGFCVINNGDHGLSWSHADDIYIEYWLWTNSMPVSDGLITDNGSTLTLDAGFQIHAQDHVSSTSSYAIWANLYNADTEGNLKVRVLKSNKECSDPIDLGIKVNKAGADRVGLLWSKDGSLTVLVNGEVKGVVADATISTVTGYLAANSGDRLFPKLNTSTSANMYVYEISVLNITGEPMELATQNAVLGDDIGFVFNTNVGAGSASATVNGQTVEADAKGKITLNLAAAQMNDEIQLTVNDDSGMTYTNTYTVRDYALAILNDDTGAYDAEKPLIKAMLSYGAAAQTYFEHNENALVTDGLNITAPTAAPVAGNAAAVTDSLDGVNYYGASLLYKNKITLRFYFTVEGSIEDYTFMLDGAGGDVLTPVAAGNYYYIDFTDIDPQELDNQKTIFVVGSGEGALTVTYGALNYLANRYNAANATAEEKALLCALAAYNLAAEAYLNA